MDLNELIIEDGETQVNGTEVTTTVEATADLNTTTEGVSETMTTPENEEAVILENEVAETEVAETNETETPENEVGETSEDDETEIEEEIVAPVITFADRATEMGLEVLEGGTYFYEDQFSKIAYKNIKTMEGSGIVDDTQISHLAIFTKGDEVDAEWKYQNFVSDSYKFLGNATLINQIKDSISEIGDTNIEERTFMSPNLTEIRHEIIISHANTIPEVGTICPMMHITNTYNGTGASKIVFGMNIAESNGDNDDVVSSFCTEKFGKIKQIHLSGSSTELSAAFGEFVAAFGANINDLVTENFNNQITETDMMKILDIIEAKAGKKRRELISNLLPETEVEEGQTEVVAWSMTSWQLFLALTRFTSVETNLNAKRILENISERVLIVPQQMIEALNVING